MRPIEFGDARDVVATLHLSRQSLEDLSYAYPSSDGFSRDCMRILTEVDAVLEARKNGPGIALVIDMETRMPRLVITNVEER